MHFSALCTFLDAVKNAKGGEKSATGREFFKQLRQEQIPLFPVIRLIVPQLDRDRQSYRIKESKISKLLIKMLGLPAGNDKSLLLKATSCTADFGDVVLSVLKKYIVSQQTQVDVEEINAYLDKIANRKSDLGLDELILEMFRKLSPTNIRWLIHIILKDLKLGVGPNAILKWFHADAANFYAANNNLGKLCETLADSNIKLNELELNIFTAFRPMLSKRCDSSNFRKTFPAGKSFLIENKFDGERFQMHMRDANFRLFSRNGYDFTAQFHTFTARLQNVFDPNTKTLILDGEMMLWNTNTQSFGSKGMNLDVKKLTSGKYQPCFCVFDVLMHNDKVLTNLPLNKRLEGLKRIVNPVPGTIILSQFVKGEAADIINALNDAVDRNEEGVVVKDPQSVYKFAERNGGWYKIKMEYFDDVVNDLDVLVMGAYFSIGKVSSLMVGIASGADTYLSLGSISSGLNAEQRDLLTSHFQQYGISFRHFSTRTKGKLLFGRETPEMYIEPEDAYVLQIRATELTRSTTDAVKTPYTFRFPRVLKIRQDKTADEVLSMNELLELTNQNSAVVKLNKRHIDLDEIASKARPKKRPKLELITMQVETGNFLKGKRFYVDSGTAKWGSEEIYYAIKKSGAEVSYRLEANIDVVLVADLTPKILSLVKQENAFDIVHVDWMQRVLECKELLEYKQNEIIYCGANYRKTISTNFDRYGDGFIEEATSESLRCVFDRMTRNDDFLHAIRGCHRFFNKYVAYFDSFEQINDRNSKLLYYSLPDQMEFRYYGGKVANCFSLDVNIVVMQSECEKRRKLICKYLEEKRYFNVDIVTRDFISKV